jgi:acyl carrier protein
LKQQRRTQPPVRKDVMGKNLHTDVRQFILKKFPLARKQQVKDSDALLESGMVDSQGVLEVVNFIEQEFSITVADDDLVPENFQTIERIAAFVQSKTHQGLNSHDGIGTAR